MTVTTHLHLLDLRPGLDKTAWSEIYEAATLGTGGMSGDRRQWREVSPGKAQIRPKAHKR